MKVWICLHVLKIYTKPKLYIKKSVLSLYYSGHGGWNSRWNLLSLIDSG